MTLEEVIAELEALGIRIDIELLGKHNNTEEQLLEVEKNLWNLHRNILAQRNSTHMMTGI